MSDDNNATAADGGSARSDVGAGSVVEESADEQTDAVFEIEDARVTFEMDRGESRVLDDASLDIQRDEILGIVGESGSGKSMFASALLDAVVEPGILSGDITYNTSDGDAIDVLDLSPDELRRFRWEEVAMVFQGAMSSFNPTKTIRSHFEETVDAHGHERAEAMARADELLSGLYLEPERVLDAYPHELSGGMQQRALIALALVLEPDVLIMDEPTAALDLLMQRSILSLIEDLQRRYDLTVVFITHDLPLVAGLADRLAVMYAFEFVEVGPSDTILSGSRHPYTRALLNAVPNLQTPLDEMRPIDGSAPDPVNVPQGCSYHPRCPLADDRCEAEAPSLLTVDGGHGSACHYWDETEEAIPLAIQEDAPDSHVQIQGTQSQKPVVSLDGVDIHFEEGSSGVFDFFEEPDVVRAVDDVNLNVYENDVVALVGESGCGKTTLGKAAIGVQRPTDGNVVYRDQDVWDARDGTGEVDIPYERIRRMLQIVHQDPGSSLNPNRTVEHNIARVLKRWYPELDEHDRRERIHGILEHVGMTPPEDYAGRYPHQLSGGEKQRVALVRAMLISPDVILADEAVSALDVSLRVEMMDLMLDLQDIFDTSYLFISHNLSNARYFAGKVGGRIGVMYLGEIVEIGPAEEVIRNPKHPYTKVLRWSTPDMDIDAERTSDPPIRGIDIPDPVDPPSGCRFHTRCPEAREVCTQQHPEVDGDGSDSHTAACFRDDEDHEYWNSDPIDGAGETDT
jgi:peptide/nickel transport system ATP-binding protein